MKKLLIKAVDIYSAKISPHKGFNCTYRIVYGTPSCSKQAKKYIEDHNVFLSIFFIIGHMLRCLHVRLLVFIIFMKCKDSEVAHRFVRRSVRKCQQTCPNRGE
jgi:putative component of membrane protein insertase Oxa1/YidC/SpoIIIJ protein YidD